MGYKELIDALRNEGEEKVRAIRQEAEEASKSLREEASGRIEALREEYNKRHSVSVAEHRDSFLSEAKNRARDIRLISEKELSERLYNLAAKSLCLLRDKKYGNIFDSILKELPPLKWKAIRVNAEDASAAKRYFPEPEIITDNSISGGLDVTEAESGIRIINTFEKRLERAWMDILPELINEIYKEAL